MTALSSYRRPVPPLDLQRTQSNGLVGCLLVAMAFNTFDVHGYLRSAGNVRYVLLIPPLVAVILASRRASTPLRNRIITTVCGVLFLYCAIALCRTYLGGAPFGSDTQVLIFPLVIVSMSPWVASRSVLNEEAWRKAARGIAIIGTAYIALHLLSRTVLAGYLSQFSYSHEKAHILFGGLAACAYLRWRVLFVFDLIASVLIFRNYPAATYVVCFVVVALSCVAVSHSRSGVRAAGRILLFAVGGALFTLLALFLPYASSLASAYLAAVGKSDTALTRQDLLDSAFVQIRQHPLFGHGLTGSTTLLTNINGRLVQVPLHNDYIEFLFVGGATGLFCVCTIIAYHMRSSFRDLSQLGAAERTGRSILVAVVLSALASSLFNPVLLNLASMVTVFTALTCLGTKSSSLGGDCGPAPFSMQTSSACTISPEVSGNATL